MAKVAQNNRVIKKTIKCAFILYHNLKKNQ